MEWLQAFECARRERARILQRQIAIYGLELDVDDFVALRNLDEKVHTLMAQSRENLREASQLSKVAVISAFLQAYAPAGALVAAAVTFAVQSFSLRKRARTLAQGWREQHDKALYGGYNAPPLERFLPPPANPGPIPPYFDPGNKHGPDQGYNQGF